jgi:hypothetical protein
MALRSSLNIFKWRVIPNFLPATRKMSSSNGSAPRPFRVLVVGGSYAGLSATLNLLDLCGGKAPRFTPDQKSSAQLVPIDITIVDERDGFCERNFNDHKFRRQRANSLV